MKYQILLILVGLIIANPVMAQSSGLAGKTIHICDDGAEWAPFTYYERSNGEKTKNIVGYSVDVIREILSKNNLPFTIDLLPWKRCLAEIEKGTEYYMLLSASKNPEREKKFHISEPYYSTTPHYYWSKKHHPEGLDVKVPTDLNNYQIGTVSGYANSMMKKLNIDLRNMDDGASDMKALVRKLHAGRVDVFEEGWEILSGMSVIGFYDFVHDQDLGRAPFPGADKNNYYMMFTKKGPIGLALKDLIDREIILMRSSGNLEGKLKKYTQ